MTKTKMAKKTTAKSSLPTVDRILESAGWFSLVTLGILTVFTYVRVPDIIPVHFNVMGRPDAYGDKRMLFFVLGIACFIFFSITLTVKYVFNSPKARLTPNKNLDFAIRIIRFLKLIVILGFIYIVVITNLIVDRITDGLGSLFLPLAMIALIFPVAFFFKRNLREKMTRKQ